MTEKYGRHGTEFKNANWLDEIISPDYMASPVVNAKALMESLAPNNRGAFDYWVGMAREDAVNEDLKPEELAEIARATADVVGDFWPCLKEMADPDSPACLKDRLGKYDDDGKDFKTYTEAVKEIRKHEKYFKMSEAEKKKNGLTALVIAEMGNDINKLLSGQKDELRFVNEPDSESDEYEELRLNIRHGEGAITDYLDKEWMETNHAEELGGLLPAIAGAMFDRSLFKAGRDSVEDIAERRKVKAKGTEDKGPAFRP